MAYFVVALMDHFAGAASARQQSAHAHIKLPLNDIRFRWNRGLILLQALHLKWAFGSIFATPSKVKGRGRMAPRPFMPRPDPA